jgi:hypothetical protein
MFRFFELRLGEPMVESSFWRGCVTVALVQSGDVKTLLAMSS